MKLYDVDKPVAGSKKFTIPTIAKCLLMIHCM